MEDVPTAPAPATGRPLAGTAPVPSALTEPPLPPVRTTPGLRPAMIVLVLAALVVGTIILVGAFSTGGPGARNTPGGGLGAVAGTSLRAAPALGALRPIEQSGQPPNNILRALTLPVGATMVSTADNTTDNGYDEQVTFSSTASQADLLAFFAAQLPRLGWKVESDGSAPGVTGGQQVLAQLAGSDGYYWEAGATVSPTRFPAGGPPTGTTRFTLRLIQVADDD